MENRGFAISFSWLFSLIAGAVILFIAIFVAMSLIDQGGHEVNTKTTQALINVLDPLLTSVEEGKTDKIELVKKTRIYTECFNSGDFGENRMQLSEESGFAEEWSERGGSLSARNQYIFVEDLIEGKYVYFFILPFEMPYKIADLMIMHTKQYCFVNPPEEVERFVGGLINNGGENMNISSDRSKCVEGSVSVCFSYGDGCDVVVEGRGDGHSFGGEYEVGYVRKNNSELFYVGNLLYAAIFSSEDNYDCGVKRVMKRAEYLTDIYRNKVQFVSVRGCDTGLIDELSLLKGAIDNFDKNEDLADIKLAADDLDSDNERLICQLY